MNIPFKFSIMACLSVVLAANRAFGATSLVTADASAKTVETTHFPPQAQGFTYASNSVTASGAGQAEAGGNSSGDLTKGTLTGASHACSMLLDSDPPGYTTDNGGGNTVTEGYFIVTSSTLAAGTPVTVNFSVQMSASTQVTWSVAGGGTTRSGASSVNGQFRVFNTSIDLSGDKVFREDGTVGIYHETLGMADGTKVSTPISTTVGHVFDVRAALSTGSGDACNNGETTDANAQASLAWGWDSTGDVQLRNNDDGSVAPPSSNVNDSYLHSVTPAPITFPEPGGLISLAVLAPKLLLARRSRR